MLFPPNPENRVSTTDTSPSAPKRLPRDRGAGRNACATPQSIGRVIFGQQPVIRSKHYCIAQGGHVLLIACRAWRRRGWWRPCIPYWAWTSPHSMSPDLMPANLGSEVLEEGEGGRRSFVSFGDRSSARC